MSLHRLSQANNQASMEMQLKIARYIHRAVSAQLAADREALENVESFAERESFFEQVAFGTLAVMQTRPAADVAERYFEELAEDEAGG